MRDFGSSIPAPESILNVVAALREVSRIGEAAMISITASEVTPWLTAFLKWCLGEPPTLCMSNGQPLMDQPQTPVKVIYSAGLTEVDFPALSTRTALELQIEIWGAFDKFAHVITSSPREDRLYFAGMVDIRSHAKGVLVGDRIDNLIRHAALVDAVLYALDLFRNVWQPDPPKNARYSTGQTDLIYGPNAFPTDAVIVDILRRYLALPDNVGWKSLDSLGLPMYEELRLRKRVSTEPLGQLERLLNCASVVTADILSLSLFNGSLDSLLVYHDANDTEQYNRGLARKIKAGLKDPKSLTSRCKGSLRDVLGWALELVGHDVSKNLHEQEWIGSSSHGQVVFPKLFEEHVLRSTGYLELFALPGVLTLPEQGTKAFPLAKGIRRLTAHYDAVMTERAQGSITELLNLYPYEQLLWKAQPLEDCLSISLGWTRNHRRASPTRLLENIASAVFVGPCSHTYGEVPNNKPPYSAKIELVEPAASPPESSMGVSGCYKNGMNSPVYVYPVAGNRGLRMLALATVPLGRNGVSAVINAGACINCALEKCKTAKREVLIL